MASNERMDFGAVGGKIAVADGKVSHRFMISCFLFLACISSCKRVYRYNFSSSVEYNREDWEILGDFLADDESISFLAESKGIMVLSHRTANSEFDIDFCGQISDISLLFSPDVIEKPEEPAKSLALDIVRDQKKGGFDISFRNGSSIIGSSKTSAFRSPRLCFSFISIRGEMGLFIKPSNDVIFQSSNFLLPQGSSFGLLSRKKSSISQLSFEAEDPESEGGFDEIWNQYVPKDLDTLRD